MHPKDAKKASISLSLSLLRKSTWKKERLCGDIDDRSGYLVYSLWCGDSNPSFSVIVSRMKRDEEMIIKLQILRFLFLKY